MVGHFPARCERSIRCFCACLCRKTRFPRVRNMRQTRTRPACTGLVAPPAKIHQISQASPEERTRPVSCPSFRLPGPRRLQLGAGPGASRTSWPESGAHSIGKCPLTRASLAKAPTSCSSATVGSPNIPDMTHLQRGCGIRRELDHMHSRCLLAAGARRMIRLRLRPVPSHHRALPNQGENAP